MGHFHIIFVTRCTILCKRPTKGKILVSKKKVNLMRVGIIFVGKPLISTNITLEPLSLFCQSTAMQYELNYLGFNRRLVSNVVQHSKWWLSPSPLNFSSVEIGVGASWWRNSKRAGSLVTGRRIWGGDVFFSRLDGENLELHFCSL